MKRLREIKHSSLKMLHCFELMMTLIILKVISNCLSGYKRRKNKRKFAFIGLAQEMFSLIFMNHRKLMKFHIDL